MGDQSAKSQDSLGDKLEKAFATQTLEKTLSVLQFPSPKGLCFNCGKSSNLKRNCFETRKAKPPDICPQCKKGKHFANQCHSKFDIKGRLLLVNRKKSTQHHCMEKQIVAAQFPENVNNLRLSGGNVNQMSFITSRAISQVISPCYPQGHGVNRQIPNQYAF